MTTIFGSDTPANHDNSNGAPGITVGTRIRCNVAGNITTVRWWCPATAPAAAQWILVRYVPATDSAGAGIGSGNFPALTPDAWNVVSVGPFAMSAGDEFVVEEWNSEGRYTNTGNYFGSDVNRPNVSPVLTGPADDTVFPRHNGRFNVGGAIAFPQDGFNATGYFIDVDFVPSTVDATVAATAVPAITAVPTPVVRGAAVVAGASSVAGITGVPTPIVSGAALVAPAAVAGITSIPTPIVHGSALVTPAAVAAVAGIPTPQVNPSPVTTGPVIHVGAPRRRWTVDAPRTRWRVE